MDEQKKKVMNPARITRVVVRENINLVRITTITIYTSW